MKKLISVLLLLSVLLSVFASCAAGNDGKDDNNSNESKENAVETAENGQKVPNIEKQNYDKDFRMLVYENMKGSWFYAEKSEGEVLNDAIFEMNSKVADQLGIRIKYTDVANVVTGHEQLEMLLPSLKANDDEYQLVEGKWPTNYNEVVLEVDENNEITDYALYSLGLLDQDELVKNYQKILNGETDKISKTNLKSYSVDDILNLKFRLVLNSDLYQKVNGLWINQSENELYMQDVVSKSPEIKVVGIIKPSESTVSQPTMGGVYYTKAMEEYVTSKTENAQIVKEQKSNPNINIFTQAEFASGQKMSMSNLTNEQMMQLSSMSQEELMNYMNTNNENMIQI